MSFLPYGQVSFGAWFGAMGGSVAAHAVFIGGFVLLQGANAAEPVAARSPSFTITLEQLDTAALMGITDSTGTATEADPTSPEQLEPVSSTETPDPATIATEPATTEPEQPPEPEAETPAPEAAALATEALEPEAPQPTTPEPTTPEPAAPETLQATAPDDTGSPDTLAAQPILPEAVLPTTAEQSLVVPETVAALPSPVLPDETALAGAAPVTLTAQPVAPVTPDSAAAAVRPATDQDARPTSGTATTLAPLNARPQPPAQPSRTPPTPPPSAQDIALGDLIQRIRSALADPCLIALPRRDGADGVGLAMIAAQDSAMEAFATGFLTEQDSALRQTRTLVNALQCPALTYVRQNSDYPATRIGLALDQTELASGERLTGVINGGAGRFITLLLIDDNGVVQDLQRFLAFSGNLVRFDVPVTRNGPSRDTRQILLAIGSATPPGPLRDRSGQLAADVFLSLPDALSTGAALGLATFDVR